MLKMLRYMKTHIFTILGIVALLFIQAYCDLSLPTYTSYIVDVGVQQKGIEDAVPEKIRKESFETLKLLMSDEDKAFAEQFYELDNDIYVLGKISKDQRNQLNTVFEKPMSAVIGAKQQGMDISKIPEAQIKLMLPVMEKKFEEVSDMMLSQLAAVYVQEEYEAIGMDLGAIQLHYILFSGLKMLGIAMISMLCAVIVTFLASRIGAYLGRELRNDVYCKVLSYSSSEMNKFSTASLITRSTNDIQQVQMVMTFMLRIILYAPIVGIGGVIKVMNTAPSMSWILLVGIAAIIVVIAFLMTVAMPKFKKLQTLIDRINQVSREILTGLLVIRAFSREDYEKKRFEKANQDLTRTNLFVNRCMTFMMPVLTVIMNAITVLIVYAGAHGIDAGSLQVGDMMAFIQYAMQIIMSFLMIAMMSVMLPRANVAAERINDVLNTDTSIKEPQNAKKPSGDVQGELVFDHVCFSYPGEGEDVIHDISFSASKGETVAFIGSTGSGKSTLVNLIPRFYDVTAGSIRLDGVDVRDYALKDLRNRIGYVPQKGVLFSGTIASNLRFGDEEADEKKLREAADTAQALEFIDQKAEGFDAPIAQGGTNVSGGQKQRLSIARAIIKKPELYVFDDSFSALDFKTDAALRKALKKYTSDATTIIVAQRVSTILNADKIIVLDDGSMVGAGTHRELLETCETYRQIAKSQLSEEELGA